MIDPTEFFLPCIKIILTIMIYYIFITRNVKFILSIQDDTRGQATLLSAEARLSLAADSRNDVARGIQNSHAVVLLIAAGTSYVHAVAV